MNTVCVIGKRNGHLMRRSRNRMPLGFATRCFASCLILAGCQKTDEAFVCLAQSSASQEAALGANLPAFEACAKRQLQNFATGVAASTYLSSHRFSCEVSASDLLRICRLKRQTFAPLITEELMVVLHEGVGGELTKVDVKQSFGSF